MNAVNPIRRALRALLPGRISVRHALVVQHLGFESSDLDTLPAVLDEVGRELGLSLSLDGVSGDLVLAEQGFVAGLAPQVLRAFLEQRPLVTMARPQPNGGDAQRLALQLHAELVRQLRLLSRQRSAAESRPPAWEQSTLPSNSGFDSHFDSRQHADKLVEAELDPDRAELLNRLRRGLVDPAQPTLEAAYGHKACLAIDFHTGIAHLDELADQRLRVMREVPYLAGGAHPGAGCKQRELDLVVWDIALAAGGFRLLNSPVNWWHAPLLAQPHLSVARYTSLPQHMALARCLAAAPTSPAELRRRCRVSLTDLRGFLQACLFVGLIHWLQSAPD